MNRVLGIDLLTGPTPWIVLGIGVLGLIWLLATRHRDYVTHVVPIAAMLAVALAVLVWWLLEKKWRPWPDPIEKQVYVWIAVALLALFLLVPRILANRRWLPATVTVLAAAVVLAASGNQVNRVFDAYPTVGTLVGHDAFERLNLDQATGGNELPPVTSGPLEAAWNPPEGIPLDGAVIKADIPGTTSGFGARPAEIYVPPAYRVDPHPTLPVLVLLAGNPGSPEDWLAGGKLTQTMDAFQRAHKGLSPVVIVADGTATQLGNPLCVDSPLGNAASYLAVDVPAWADEHLQVSKDRRQWSIGGLSYGGTCSLQMATNHPDVYSWFVDLSGQLEPTLGDKQRTLDAAFGGSDAAFRKVNPLDLMQTTKFPRSGGAFVVGQGDGEYKPGMQQLYAAAQAAGMNVVYQEVAGGHSFEVWANGLAWAMPWLSARRGRLADS